MKTSPNTFSGKVSFSILPIDTNGCYMFRFERNLKKWLDAWNWIENFVDLDRLSIFLYPFSVESKMK